MVSIDQFMTFFEVATLMVSLFGVSLAFMGGVVDGVIVIAVSNLICNMMPIGTTVV